MTIALARPTDAALYAAKRGGRNQSVVDARLQPEPA
jgi:PleD family two-component response regulator